MNFEDKAESIVRSMHGKIPAWAGGAQVDKEVDDGYLIFKDATWEAIGHTGVGTCWVEPRGVRLRTWRKPSEQAIRRFCAPVFSKMLEYSTNLCPLTGKWVDSHFLYALVNGDYFLVSAMRGRGSAVRFDVSQKIGLGEQQDDGTWSESNPEAVLASLALDRRYEWTVSMRIDGSPALRFACTPGSAREAFKLRDLPPKRNRRDALIHWVSEHYRDPDIHVSEHLRGKHVFSWRGIDCEIVPSAFDREKEIARKQEMAS